MARHGTTRHGTAGQDTARHGTIRHDTTGRGTTRHGAARHDTRHDRARHDTKHFDLTTLVKKGSVAKLSLLKPSYDYNY